MKPEKMTTKQLLLFAMRKYIEEAYPKFDEEDRQDMALGMMQAFDDALKQVASRPKPLPASVVEHRAKRMAEWN